MIQALVLLFVGADVLSSTSGRRGRSSGGGPEQRRPRGSRYERALRRSRRRPGSTACRVDEPRRSRWSASSSALFAFFVALPPFTARTPVVPVVVAAFLGVAAGRLDRLARRAAGSGGCAIALRHRSGSRSASSRRASSVGNLDDVVVWSALLAATLRYATPLTFAAIGGMFCERSGVVNIGARGDDALGRLLRRSSAPTSRLAGCSGCSAAMVAGAALALIHAFFSIHLRADQIVSGTAINFLALGVTGYFFIDVYGEEGTPGDIPRIPDVNLGFLDRRLGAFLGDVFGRPEPDDLALVRCSWSSSYIVMFKTPIGLRIRSVGEHPRAADTVGISVYGVRYAAVDPLRDPRRARRRVPLDRLPRLLQREHDRRPRLHRARRAHLRQLEAVRRLRRRAPVRLLERARAAPARVLRSRRAVLFQALPYVLDADRRRRRDRPLGSARRRWPPLHQAVEPARPTGRGLPTSRRLSRSCSALLAARWRCRPRCWSARRVGRRVDARSRRRCAIRGRVRARARSAVVAARRARDDRAARTLDRVERRAACAALRPARSAWLGLCLRRPTAGAVARSSTRRPAASDQRLRLNARYNRRARVRDRQQPAGGAPAARPRLPRGRAADEDPRASTCARSRTSSSSSSRPRRTSRASCALRRVPRPRRAALRRRVQLALRRRRGGRRRSARAGATPAGGAAAACESRVLVARARRDRRRHRARDRRVEARRRRRTETRVDRVDPRRRAPRRRRPRRRREAAASPRRDRRRRQLVAQVHAARSSGRRSLSGTLGGRADRAGFTAAGSGSTRDAPGNAVDLTSTAAASPLRGAAARARARRRRRASTAAPRHVDAPARGRRRHRQRARPRRAHRPERPVPRARAARARARARRGSRSSGDGEDELEAALARGARRRPLRRLGRPRADARRPHGRARSRARAGRGFASTTSSHAEIEGVSRAVAERLRRPYADFEPGVRKQATLPEGATSLGLAGTAPGLVLENGTARRRRCPGRPASCSGSGRRALETEPVRRVLARARPPGRRVLRFFGASESAVARALAEAGGDGDGVEATICARDFEIHVDLVVEPGRGAGGGRARGRAASRRSSATCSPRTSGRSRSIVLDALPGAGLDARDRRVVHGRDGRGAAHVGAGLQRRLPRRRSSRTRTR